VAGQVKHDKKSPLPAKEKMTVSPSRIFCASRILFAASSLPVLQKEASSLSFAKKQNGTGKKASRTEQNQSNH